MNGPCSSRMAAIKDRIDNLKFINVDFKEGILNRDGDILFEHNFVSKFNLCDLAEVLRLVRLLVTLLRIYQKINYVEICLSIPKTIKIFL